MVKGRGLRSVPKRIFTCPNPKCGTPLYFTIEVSNGEFKIKQGEATMGQSAGKGIIHCLACKAPMLLIQLEFTPRFRILFTTVDQEI